MQENLGLGKIKRRELEDHVKRSDSSSQPKEERITETTSKASQEQSDPRSKTSTLLSLSALPSSFTTYLLSLIDSPAYANLTTAYLRDVFNPSTPDDPNVKYFSVAGRMEGLPIWHPLWLPKLVMDGAEDKARSAMKDAWEQSRSNSRRSSNEKRPLWAQDEEWGNDGLVEIQSAKWGEFLGIMEGCDRKPLFSRIAVLLLTIFLTGRLGNKGRSRFRIRGRSACHTVHRFRFIRPQTEQDLRRGLHQP
jgi:triacylglycerol lipase